MISVLACRFNILIDQEVYLVGHRKSIVDAMNILSKNILHKVPYQQIQDTKDAALVDDGTKILSVHVFEERKERISPDIL